MVDERQTQVLLSLRKITEDIAKLKNQTEIVDFLVKSIRQCTRADCCSLYLCDEQHKRYRLVATDGLLQAAVGKASLGLNEGLVGVVGQKKEILDLANAPSHPNFKYLPDVGEDEYHSFLGVPILNTGKLLGVLVVQSKEQKMFGQIEESFMVTICAQVAKVLAESHNKTDNSISTVIGLSGTGGIAIGKAMVWQPAVLIDKVKIIHCDDPSLQKELFLQTLFQLQIEMDKTALKMRENESEQAVNGFLSGYGSMLDDSSFSDEVVAYILKDGLLASSAIKRVYEHRYNEALSLGKKEESIEIRDFAQVLLSRLLHASTKEFDNVSNVILVVKTLSTTIVADLPKEKISGFVITDSDSSSSNAMILAKDLGIPVVAGASLNINTIDGRNLVINGKSAVILIDPPSSVLDEFSQLINQTKEQHDLYSKEICKPTITLDDKRITFKLNAGLNSKSDDEIENEVDGVGLYRTEIAFMLTQSFPLEQEQYEWYSSLLAKFRHKKVCMRTLDIGSDKGLSYFVNKEQNPALGLRGVRVTLDQPQILNTQLKAMLRANQDYGNLEIMLPMVSSLKEVISVKNTLKQMAVEIEESTHKTVKMPSFGVMIEVPSIAYVIDDLQEHVDFFSIGSNDLVQYLLAVDRNNPLVNRFYNPFNSAVVRSLAYFKQKCDSFNKPISICGELAGNPMGLLLLLSLGFDNLSMNYSELARAKYITRRVSVEQLRKLGQEALKLSSSTQIKALYLDYAQANGLAKVIDVKAH